MDQVPAPTPPSQNQNTAVKIIISVLLATVLIIGGYLVYKFSKSNNPSDNFDNPVASQSTEPSETIVTPGPTPSDGQAGVIVSLLTARQKAAEARIKSDLSQLRAQAEMYYDTNGNSYVGFTGSEEIVQDIKTYGAEVKFQSVTQSTYLAYVILPHSKTIYCVDSTGFAAVVPRITPDQKTCQ